jgi:hypothetical protein
MPLDFGAMREPRKPLMPAAFPAAGRIANSDAIARLAG